MSDMHVKQNQRHQEVQQQQHVEQHKKQHETTNSSSSANNEHHRKDFSKVTGHKEEITAQSLDQKKQEAKMQEDHARLTIGDLQRQHRERTGIPG